jgi:hypothetical protein
MKKPAPGPAGRERSEAYFAMTRTISRHLFE